jgi:hypothetical protein
MSPDRNKSDVEFPLHAVSLLPAPLISANWVSFAGTKIAEIP